MDKTDTSNDFTILDWIGIVYIVMQIMGLFYFVRIAAAFRVMYQDFGGTLPFLTSLALNPWFPVSFAIASSGVFSLLLHKSVRVSLKRRRAVVVSSFIFASFAFAVCFVALYQPVFKLAGAVSP